VRNGISTHAHRFISHVLAARGRSAWTGPVMSETTGLDRLWPADASTLNHAVKRVRVAWLASVAAVGIGIILRLVEFLGNRSLAQDEAQLALNIMNRSFDHLFGQLDFNQAAPPAFLVVEKAIAEAMGDSEYSLRLLPFLAGTLALVLIPFLARRVVTAPAVPLAVALFALSDPLIYYTTSSKQYAVDVLITTFVLLIGFRFGDRPYKPSAALGFAGVGATSIWLSHSSVFVLAGVSATLMVGSLARRQWRRARNVAAASGVWLASFGVFVLTTLDNVSAIQRSLSSTPGALGVSGPGDGGVLTSELRTSLGAFRYVAGVPHFLERGSNDAGAVIALVVGVFCIAGLVSLLAKRPEKGLALVSPLVLMLIAWGLGEYPLLGRTQLFLAPMYVLLAAEGVVFLTKKARHRGVRTATVISVGIVGVALAAPALAHTVRPRAFHEMKPVLEYIGREELAGDSVYVFYTAQPQLRYYLECNCAGAHFEAAKDAGLWPLRPGRGGPGQWAPALRSVPPRLIVAQDRGDDPSSYLSDLDSLRGRKRVWVLLPAIWQSTRATFLRELDRRGRRRATFGVGDVGDSKSAVVVYLYDMTQPTRQPNAP
jgi:hypothetical protein